ncbi:MAG: TonB-dependent receptor plug domain-containing protein [Marinicellaceae bacterium]
MKTKRNLIAEAIRRTLYTGVIASVALTGVSYAQDNSEESAELDKITVTGSRLKRSDTAEALPVTVIDREQIELSGESNAADLIRNLTFNSSGSVRPQSGSSIQGVSTVSLRGIGANRTLVLIDGRRLPVSPSSGQSQDLNSIPLGAIERIEILTDGASAIYGSDAIGGVVNVILRNDYEGFEVSLGGEEVSFPANGGERSSGSVLFGASGEKTSILGGVSWNDREIIFARDFAFNQIGGSTFSNNFRNVSPTTGGETGSDFAVRNGCAFPNTGYYILDPTDPNSRCAYDFTLESADEASIDNSSMFVKVKHEINDDWRVWANAGIYKTDSFGRYAPVPDGSAFSGTGAPLTASSINNPSNPLSPNYDPVNFPNPVDVHWRHRFDALGNRDNNVANERTSFEMGFIGQVAEAEVEFGVTRMNNRTVEIGRNYLLRSAAAAAIENGTYLLTNPYGADPAVLNSLRVTTNRDSLYDLDTVFGSVAFDAFEMTNGAVSVFVGAEYQDIKYADIYDSLSEAGQVGGSGGNSAAGARDIGSVFFEAMFPLMENLELNVAGRYDDYSDFGGEFSPKISLRYQPLDNLTVRGSWGEGYRAPTLDILTQQPSDSADSVNDPQTCLAEGLTADCETQVQAQVIANPDLLPELSDQFSFGVAYEPLDWFSVSLDYFNIEINNEIRNFSPQQIVDFDNSGDPGVAGLGVVRDPATGAITLLTRGAANRGLLNTSGFDLNMLFNYEALGGQLTHNVQLSHLITQSLDGGRDLVNDPGTPADRLGINNIYNYGDWTLAYNLNLIGDQFDDVDETFNGDGVAVTGVGIGHVPTYVTHDLQLTYNASWDAKITVGVRNIGEKIAPIGLGFTDGRDYDFNLYDAYGRISYIRYTQSF